MKPRIKVGLLVGIISLIVNMIVSAILGICGPLVILLAGAVAGFMSAQQEKAASKSDGARLGAVAGAIAGALAAIGQLFGGIAALAFIQFSGMNLGFGSVPPPSADANQQALYYLSGAGTALCFGLGGLVLAALAGAATGYMGTSATAEIPQTEQIGQ